MRSLSLCEGMPASLLSAMQGFGLLGFGSRDFVAQVCVWCMHAVSLCTTNEAWCNKLYCAVHV